jgi:DNA-binding transcriptional regulator YhcF (GntR family)
MPHESGPVQSPTRAQHGQGGAASRFRLDRRSGVPAFRQIVGEISSRIASGAIGPGARLPTERELAAALKVARGTVTRAYEELERTGAIEVLQGRGSFARAPAAAGRKGTAGKAADLITGLIDGLAELRFTHAEMRTMVDLAIREREERHGALAVAAVDCNPETLGMFERQIGLLSRVSVSKFLLSDLAADPRAARRLEGFDLVLTTATHAAELAGIAPGRRDRIVAVGVAPSQETIMRLASVKPDQPVGVTCESRQFLAIIEARLREMRFTGPFAVLFTPRQPGALAGFLRGRLLLVVPPGYAAGLTREEARALEEFSQRGGTVVAFDYQVEKGSLAHVEGRIGALLS